MQLYLDSDGVLADFDHGAIELPGMPPHQRNAALTIAALTDFGADMPAAVA